MPQPFTTLLPSASRTATGNYEFDLTRFMGGRASTLPPMMSVQSDVTAVSGTPTMTVLVQDTLDGTNWNTVGTFTAQTAVNRQVIQIALSGVAQAAGFRWPFNYRSMRILWTIGGGSPNLTFSVKAAIY